MKKFSFLMLLCVFFLIGFPNEGKAAAVQSKIILDGKEIIMPANVQVQVVNENVMIPIRVVVENLKFKVDWDSKSQGVKIQQDSKIISLTVNQQQATVDGKQVLLNAAPQVQNETVVVPIRFVSEQMGIAVSWDNMDKTVYLTSSSKESVNGGQAGTGTGTIATPETTKPTVDSGAGGVTVNPINNVNGLSYINNQLTVTLNGNVTPEISTLTNPDRIVVDLPNTTFASNFSNNQTLDTSLKGTLDTSGYPDVSEVRYSLFTRDPYKVRVVIALSNSRAYQLIQEKDSNTIVIDLNASIEGSGTVPITTPTTDPVINSGHKVVVIDPGHGGKDPGALSITSKHEKDFNLSVGLKVQALLLKEPNIDVVMTRDSDTYPTLSERAQLANKLNADVFVSIHGNSNPSSKANGTETYYYQRSSSKDLATVIHKYLAKATGLTDRGVKSSSLHVIRETKMPAILVEVGFLSNTTDETAMFTDDVQNRVAQAIVDGIKEYMGVK